MDNMCHCLCCTTAAQRALRRLFDRAFPAPPWLRSGLSEAEPSELNLELGMQRGVCAWLEAVRESCVKSPFVNGLTGELHNLVVKEDNILDQALEQITCRVQNVEAEIGGSLKISAVNSQPCGDSFVPDAALQEMIATVIVYGLTALLSPNSLPSLQVHVTFQIRKNNLAQFICFCM